MQKIVDDFIEKTKKEGFVINSVQTIKNGQLTAEYLRLNSKVRLDAFSVSKSFTSIGAGIAIDEGIIRLDEKIADSFREEIPAEADEKINRITVEHLLTMTCGLEKSLFFTGDPERYITQDWLDHFFRASFTHEPGSHFLYSNFNAYVLGCLIEKKTGKNLLDYMRPRLFEPLEIYSPDWFSCPKGHTHAASELYLTIDEFSRFGEMLLNKGVYKGKRIVSEQYIEAATQNQVKQDPPSNGYGYQIWINPDKESYHASGRFGQFIFVLPKHDLVVSVQSLEEKDLNAVVWNELVQKLIEAE